MRYSHPGHIAQRWSSLAVHVVRRPLAERRKPALLPLQQVFVPRESGAEPTAYPSALTRSPRVRSEEHTSELQSLMRISYAVFCLKKKKSTLLKAQISTHIKQQTI